MTPLTVHHIVWLLFCVLYCCFQYCVVSAFPGFVCVCTLFGSIFFFFFYFVFYFRLVLFFVFFLSEIHFMDSKDPNIHVLDG